MKTLITTIITIGLLFAASADEMQTLTSSNDVYRATVKTNDVVFYNIVGKTSPAKTNLVGWNMLKTNLLSQGYALEVKTTKAYGVTKAFNKEDLATKNNRLMWEDIEREEEIKRAAIAKAVVERAGLIGYNLKKRDEKIAEGLSYLQSR